MDAQARKKALYRAKLKDSAQKREKRIDSPLVRYNEFDQPVCRVCDVILKSESLWPAHQASRKHHEAIKNVKASAAGLTRINDVNPEPTELQKSKGLTRLNDVNPEPPTELQKPKSEPPTELHKARSSSVLPADFFDNNETKRQKTGLGTGGKFESSAPQASAKLVDSDSSPHAYEKTEHSALNHPMELSNSENRMDSSNVPTIQTKGGSEIEPSSKLSHTSRKSIGSDVKQVKGALPEGFFDNKDADLRARGIEPVKLDIKDEYKEFEKVIQEDLQEVDERFEEEEFDAAEVREEAESLEQKACRERVEMLKKKQMELKAAKFAGQKDHAVMGKESSSEESSGSDEDDNERDFAVDWRAKHL